MRFTIILSFILITFSSVYSQNIFSLSKTVRIENVKKKKLYKELNNWFYNQNNFSNIIDNNDDKLIAEGFTIYKNPVKYENSSNLSRVYAQQTEGKLKFKIEISIKDNEYSINLTRIKHVPDNQWDNINFGIITTDITAPKAIIEEVGEKWSNDVWVDIKSQITKKFDDIVSTLPVNLTSLN